MFVRGSQSVLIAIIVVSVLAGAAHSQLPALGAGGLLHPLRRPVVAPPPTPCVDAVFLGAGVNLKGWRCHAAGVRRGSIVYLHGVADNRQSAIGVIQRFTARGFDVVAYDSRAHGESQGATCTYGFLEAQDLQRVLDTLESGPIVLLGTSLGAAVALQHAARDRRVTAVIAAETFSDLRTIATERAPFFITPDVLRRAFMLAEQWGGFQLDAVSPVRAAAHIVAPVLLIHGEADVDTLPAHSQRVLAALKGPKRLMLVPGATHNGSLRAEVWEEIESWIHTVISGATLNLPS
jgi:pimeloyl-ACP methyl ester carboxylesterase